MSLQARQTSKIPKEIILFFQTFQNIVQTTEVISRANNLKNQYPP